MNSLDVFVYSENENLIFRGNTFATKAVDTYMKMVGENVSIYPDVQICRFSFLVSKISLSLHMYMHTCGSFFSFSQ